MLVAHAALAAILAARGAAPGPPCDGSRAVEEVRAAATRDRLDLSNLQLVVEGPYRHAKVVRTHPTFRADPALKRTVGRRTFYFVWFHPPFLGPRGARGTDLWALVEASRCELLHLAREG